MRNSMKQQRRFTKEFEEEAVRLVQTSGRTQREIAGDLGIGLSTLVRWIGRSRAGRLSSCAKVGVALGMESTSLPSVRPGRVRPHAVGPLTLRLRTHPSQSKFILKAGRLPAIGCLQIFGNLKLSV